LFGDNSREDNRHSAISKLTIIAVPASFAIVSDFSDASIINAAGFLSNGD
jgi:hypothetical protein